MWAAVPHRIAAAAPSARAGIAACAWAAEAVSTAVRLLEHTAAAETAARLPRSSQPAGLAARTAPMVREHIANILLAGSLRLGRRRHSPALLQNIAGAEQDRARTPDTAAAFWRFAGDSGARSVRSNPARRRPLSTTVFVPNSSHAHQACVTPLPELSKSPSSEGHDSKKNCIFSAEKKTQPLLYNNKNLATTQESASAG